MSPPIFASSSVVLSVYALSTRITSKVAPLVASASFTRHCSVSSARLKTGMTIEQSNTGASARAAPGPDAGAASCPNTGACTCAGTEANDYNDGKAENQQQLISTIPSAK